MDGCVCVIRLVFLFSYKARLSLFLSLPHLLFFSTCFCMAILYFVRRTSGNSFAPSFEKFELGIGGHVVSQAIIEATGCTAASISAAYKRLGDIGDVAQDMKNGLRCVLFNYFITHSQIHSFTHASIHSGAYSLSTVLLT